MVDPHTLDHVLEDLDVYQQYIENNFEEGNHQTVDSDELFNFGKQTFYVLSSIIEYLQKHDQ